MQADAWRDGADAYREPVSERRWVPVDEAAKKIGVHPDTIRKWIRDGIFPAQLHTGRIYIDWPAMLAATEPSRRLRRGQ